ncbi:hypothetical protein [Paenibacillus wulumuqiensis]|uniref:hypothetical protein n=1 Tax=Paenibacillus wulumuqiensis TaxID=1567107 RepID=UPI00128BDEF5|nr:hypothetical protein [Paenibacillus wulumuqiensis]
MVLLIGCNKEPQPVPVNPTVQSTKSESASEPLLNYNDYNQLFTKMVVDMNLRDHVQVDKTTSVNIVAIEPEYSFGKRKYLTADGEQSATTTQRRIIYKEKQADVYTLIDVIYTDHSMGKDMIYWPTQSLDIYQKQNKLKKYDQCMLAYNNVLINITRISKNKPLELAGMQHTIESVTDYLSHYKNN